MKRVARNFIFFGHLGRAGFHGAREERSTMNNDWIQWKPEFTAPPVHLWQWVQPPCRWGFMVIPSARKSNCSESVHDFKVRHKSLNFMMPSCILIWVLLQPSANPRKSKFHLRKELIRLHTVTFSKSYEIFIWSQRQWIFRFQFSSLLIWYELGWWHLSVWCLWFLSLGL